MSDRLQQPSGTIETGNDEARRTETRRTENSGGKSAGRGEAGFDLNLVKVVDVGCGILHQAFFKQPRIKAKALFKDLKHGRSIALGSLTLQRRVGPHNPASGPDATAAGDAVGDPDGQSVEKLDIPLRLKLEKSEFRGPVNYPAFEAALKGMLMRISQHLRERKDLNLLTDKKGTVLVHLPGVIQVKEQFNVLVMAVEPEGNRRLILHLMFVNPDQYEALKSK